ncbi:MAG: PD40 domain-containing protein [Bacteroidetes bacterium]|nr:PD40 domain-containing protein [Bacteroidota bacterium]
MRKLLMLIVLAATFALAQQEARLLRFPALYGDNLVFTYAGDLYTVSSNGGTARKLTNDVGIEMFARFSPDGKYIAFTGQYDGNTEVYLMPSSGGIPKRLTYTATLSRDDVSDRMGPNNIVMAWKDNSTIVYRSRQIEFNDFKGELFYASINGGIPVEIPVPRGGWPSFSPDGKSMAYNQVFREFRTWKRYRGGMADDISIYNFETKKTEKITNDPAQDVFPMWVGNKIYFMSDRDGRDNNKKMNLYCYDVTTKETTQKTFFPEFDCKFPSLAGDNSAIVFENAGYLYRFDLKTEKETKITIQINDDFESGRGGLIDVSKSITSFDISPDGNRALFGARGDVFTVPAKNGPTRNLTNTSGVHERNSRWSPDGKYISYISDATGEDELWIRPQDGLGQPVQLTKNSSNYKYEPVWSPDSKKLLWGDRAQHLWFVDIDSKKVTEVAKSDVWEFSDYSWSPDSKWITYANPEAEVMQKIKLYSLELQKTIEVTDGWYASANPVFSPDGKYLFFTSDRNFNPTYSQTEWNHSYTDMAGIYFVTLAKETKSPFEPKSDEVKIKEETKKDDKKKNDDKKKDEESKVTVKVDADGLVQRIVGLPIQGSNYGNISVIGNKVYYSKRSSKDFKTSLMLYDLEKQKETELGDVRGYEISADQKKMLILLDGNYSIIDLPTGKIETKEKLNLSDLKVTLDRRAEWKQIFDECWRQMRDFFYAPNMHGVDWKAKHDQYAQLLPYVNHRIDLTYFIGEMISELNIGHAYVGGGDYPKPERIPLGLLGAKIERDPSSKFYKITKILKGQNWDKNLRSPLTEIGVDVKEGDYILAIDGKPTNTMNDLFEALVGKADKQVVLKVNSSPKEAGSRETTVLPTASEAGLYYYNWVQGNIEKVNKATDGKVGYIHIPDMGVNGLNEFAKYYYPQLRKEALIIDDRGNGGGNVSPMIAERLNRQLAMITIARNTLPGPNPDGMHLGPKVLLTDEFSASDGDIFPYRFRKYNLGKIIGRRTWGGVVGIRGSLPLLDGGFMNRPEFSRYDNEGKEWIMEGHGVDPDIQVDNDPSHEFNGIDDQLNKAIEVIKEELKNVKYKIPNPPPYPDKSR